MAHLSALIDDIVRGEDRSLPRTVDLTPLDGDSLVMAWFTVKANETDSDADAIFQKEITSAQDANGQIDVTGGGNPIVNAHLNFLIPSASTLLLDAWRYYFYDIKGLSSGGAKKVLEAGRIIAAEQITQAES